MQDLSSSIVASIENVRNPCIEEISLRTNPLVGGCRTCDDGLGFSQKHILSRWSSHPVVKVLRSYGRAYNMLALFFFLQSWVSEQVKKVSRVIELPVLVRLAFQCLRVGNLTMKLRLPGHRQRGLELFIELSGLHENRCFPRYILWSHSPLLSYLFS